MDSGPLVSNIGQLLNMLLHTHTHTHTNTYTYTNAAHKEQTEPWCGTTLMTRVSRDNLSSWGLTRGDVDYVQV